MSTGSWKLEWVAPETAPWGLETGSQNLEPGNLELETQRWKLTAES
jgi:hypothetical protein